MRMNYQFVKIKNTRLIKGGEYFIDNKIYQIKTFTRNKEGQLSGLRVFDEMGDIFFIGKDEFEYLDFE